jgi:hypothetical protein
MNKIIVLFFVFFTTNINASHQSLNPYKSCVLEFYKMLLVDSKVTVADVNKVMGSDDGSEADLLIEDHISKQNQAQLSQYVKCNSATLESYYFKKIRAHVAELSQGCNFETISKLINNSNIYNEGWDLGSYVELKFPNGIILYFEMNTDPPESINCIWLPSGKALDVYNNGNEMLRRPAIINDKDGFTNVRKEANANSQVVGKFVTNELFFFTPVSGSNWWPVYRNETSSCIGYIYKNKITFYRDFPEFIKKEVIKMRTGC